MPYSLRRQILEKMKETLLAINTVDSSGQPTDWPVKFSHVGIGPLDDNNQRQRYSIGLVASGEVYGALFPYITRELRVAIEYRITINKGDAPPALEAETVLEVLERLVLSNRTWAGLAVDTDLESNEIDLDNQLDRAVYGVLFVKVQYRHGQRDPRDGAPTFGS